MKKKIRINWSEPYAETVEDFDPLEGNIRKLPESKELWFFLHVRNINIQAPLHTTFGAVVGGLYSNVMVDWISKEYEDSKRKQNTIEYLLYFYSEGINR